MATREYESAIHVNRGSSVQDTTKTSCNQFLTFLKSNSRYASYHVELGTAPAGSLRGLSDDFIKEHYETILPEFATFLILLGVEDVIMLGTASNYFLQVKLALATRFKHISILRGLVPTHLSDYWTSEYKELAKAVKKAFFYNCGLTGKKVYNPPPSGTMADLKGN